MKTALLGCVIAIGITVSALAGMTFTYPEQINILERWDVGGGPNGTYYYYDETRSSGTPLSRAMWYKPDNGALYGDLPAGGVTATIEFKTPMQLDHLTMQWRNRWDHVPDTWAIYDQTGLIASGSRGPESEFTANLMTYPMPPDPANPGSPRPASEYLRIETSGGSQWIDLIQFGAYLAPGSTLAIDGTFNIFREEVALGKMTATAGYFYAEHPRGDWPQNGVGNLTDGTGATFDCGAYWSWEENIPEGISAGWVEWTLSQPYTLVGLFLSKYNPNSQTIKGLKFEAFDDAKGEWVTVFGPQDHATTDYIVFRDETGAPIEVTGSKLLMTWDDAYRGNGYEIHEIHLFGRGIPEPATMSLLALGGLALLRRRAV